jgi:acyl phosphate:glycerol-3-phosphate acyltransferase
MSRQHLILSALIAVAYLIGSIPFGLIIGLSRGIDPRTQGSGNIGATNVGRLLGGKYFALVFTLDMLKSLLPMLLAGLIAGSQVRQFGHSWQTYALWIGVGLAAVLGHMFSIFLKFKGGKGVATSAGMMFGLYPYYTLPAVGALAAFFVVLKVWRYISLGAIVGALSFPILYLAYEAWVARHTGAWGLRDRWPLLAVAVLVALLICWRHRTNIARLRAGTEPTFKKRVR